MEKFIISGGVSLQGEVTISGAKNVALKVLVASLLTDEELIIHNVPRLRDVYFMLEVLGHLGVTYTFEGNTVTLKNTGVKSISVPLDVGARLRTSSMVLGPLLARCGKAKIPNPGGCRLGARPIDRHVEGLKQMGAVIDYKSQDGFFYAEAQKLSGAVIEFTKNTHTGTETLLLAAVLAHGTTVLKNAAEEVEIDGLIELLVHMGARITRSAPREITIEGVEVLHGVEFTVMPDRNEEVTFAIAAAITKGNIVVKQSQRTMLASFLEQCKQAGLQYEAIDSTTTRYYTNGTISPTHIETAIHPGFMTDWQAPWAILMTQAQGISTIHETVFESRFSYVQELKKMGATIEFYSPQIKNPEEFYNFNWSDRIEGYHQAIRISGKTPLHDAVLNIDDLRAGATVVLAALIATGESTVYGIEQVDRGYEQFETRLQGLGAQIKRVKEDIV
jgi:UDP-N-acetylglucosamine 1-carboxyvinyltransferase